MKIETRQQLLAVLSNNETGLTTAEVAQQIDLSRSATSLYLNELLQEGTVKQTGTKPVYWLPASAASETTDDVFKAFIGSQGSAREAIKKCIAAVMYPPLGLPLLIHGPSGVGKSFLAKLIYDYLKQNNAKGAEKFFVFNCADYANNPELLSSILFGHTKGAFTGAEGERKGLLAQADQGVLFLDEVHRLSKENQEKLFQFMDSGNFRPIGEDEKLQHSQVRLLFATTETPEEVLLPTFYRRISVIIDLPSFHERPIYERFELIKYLFLQEAKRIKRDLAISQELLDYLSERAYPGNVGSLANEIRMYCAGALQKNPTAETIALILGNERPSLELHFDQINEAFAPDDLQTQQVQLQQLLASDQTLLQIQEELASLHHHLRHEAGSVCTTALGERVTASIQEQNRRVLGDLPLTEEATATVSCFLDFTENQLPMTLWENLQYRLLKEQPRTYHLAQLLTKELPLELIPAAKCLLAILLIGSVNEEIRYHALLVAHGERTASSIQGVANKMCGEYLFDAINMPLTSSVHDIVAQVKNWLSERETGDGVIMLVDMGSLTQLYKSLKPQILGELLVINNLTTSFALEIGQQLLNGSRFHTIAKAAEENFVTNVQYFEGFSVEKNIIISSISGRDVSKKLRGICQQYVKPDIKLIILNYNELSAAIDRAADETEYLKETSLILTTSYLDTDVAVPTLNLLDVLDDNAEQQLEQSFHHLIHPNNVKPMLNEFIHFFSKEGLSEKLEFLNPDVIIRQVEDTTDKCERRFGLQLNAKMKFNLTMHLALMVERTILGGADYPLPEELSSLKLNDKPFEANIKTILYNLEQFYRITISDWELYVLYEILGG